LAEVRVLDRTSTEGVILAKERVLDGTSDKDGVLNEADDEKDLFADEDG
jgi:hypothetical protein